MPILNRRHLIHVGIAIAVLFAAMPRFVTGQQSDNAPRIKNGEAKAMQIHYLEIVTPDVDALCKQYSAIHGVAFSEPNASLGNARTAKLGDGGMIGIRAPMRDSEKPVVRPYMLVKDLDKAVAAAAEAGAEVAIPRMELPGHGSIGIVILGGIDCGLWEL
jgi:predicted enzyme related to lactoylglutathione lyase